MKVSIHRRRREAPKTVRRLLPGHRCGLSHSERPTRDLLYDWTFSHGMLQAQTDASAEALKQIQAYESSVGLAYKEIPKELCASGRVRGYLILSAQRSTIEAEL